MVALNIFTGTTEKGVSLFKEYLNIFSNIKDVAYARIRYNTSHLTNEYDHPFTYPLTVYTTTGFVFCIADVTAGYPGEGPHGMVDILNYLEFKFDKNDILEKKNIVKIDLLKEGFYLKDDFSDYDIPRYRYFDLPFVRN